MAHFVVVIYFVSIVVGCSALLLFWIIYIKSKIQIIKQYVIFMLLYTIYLLIQIFNIYMRTVIHYLAPEAYIFSGSLYFVWFMFFIYETPCFFHTLVEVPFTNVKKLFFRGMSLFTFILLIIPFVIRNNPPEILKVIRFELQVVCYFFFIITLAYVVYLVWTSKDKVEGEINKKILRTIFILCIVFLPGFIADFFPYKLQVEWKIIPFGFEFNVPFYLVWNIISIIYVIQYFLSRTAIVQAPTITQEFIKKYSISRREEEIISFIFEGYSSRVIGERLFLSDKTVRNHISNIYKKVGCKNRVGLIKKVFSSPDSLGN